jgi:NTE family protein
MIGQLNYDLPRPIAFAFSGGASLGAMQVGMLRALRTAGIQPDMVVGTSVGALNGAIIADRGFEKGIDELERLWMRIRRTDIFAGGLFAQLRCLVQTGQSLFSHDQLAKLIRETLSVGAFEDLRLPLGVIATEVRSRCSTLLTKGELQPALLASSAIPGLLPCVKINERWHMDGCFSSNVPLQAAVQMGAASLVVLDTGNRRPTKPAHGLTDRLLSVAFSAFRRQVLREVSVVANRLPVVYLPAPALPPHSLLDFDGNEELIDKATACTARFLATATPPSPGAMCGALHFLESQPQIEQKTRTQRFEQTQRAWAIA